MMLPVFNEIFDEILPKQGVILCINYENYEIKPALYDALGAWSDGSLLYRDISSGEITDDISRYTHFAVVEHVSSILVEDVVREGSNLVLLNNVGHDIYTVDDGATTRSLKRNHTFDQQVLVMRIYEGIMGCIRDVGKVDVFSTVSKKKYFIYTEISHDFTVFKFKDVIDVV